MNNLQNGKKSRNSKIIARLRGGLGNQLFSYAAARRLSIVNNAELLIDDVTGFVRDKEYHRKYALDKFNIPARKASPNERLEPFERYRRGLLKYISRLKPFSKRRYIEQEKIDFDKRLLIHKFEGTIYLDGLWQSEKYFKDIESIIRKDLLISPPKDSMNNDMSEKIQTTNAVALHVRWFDPPGNSTSHNASAVYYNNAIEMIDEKVITPHYFVFSDDTKATRTSLRLPENRVTFISHNIGNNSAYADMWLMAQCKYFITANSTFSWWGAWLANKEHKIVIAPNIKISGMTAWGFPGLIPNEWIVL